MASYNYYWSGGFPVSSGGPYPVPTGIPQHTGQNATNPPSGQPLGSSPSQPVSALESDFIDLDLKILNPKNKKDFRMHVLRHISSDLDDPDKLREEIVRQCGNSLSDRNNMEIGYYRNAKKNWINNRLDMNDMWSRIEKGEKIMVWCVSKEEAKKRSLDDNKENEPRSKSAKVSTVESERELVRE